MPAYSRGVPLPRPRLVVLWTVTAAACAVWVKVTRIGPVVAVIDARRGWGVHTGDAWTLLAVAAAAAASTRWMTPRGR